MTIRVEHGDCRDVLQRLPADSIEACVTDPPYGLGFMGRAWDDAVAFRPETWAEVLRVLKPGGYLLAFGGTRTYHRLAAAIEDAGFEMRDTIAWLYGSGFPKSLDIGKAIDKRRVEDAAASQWSGWGTALKPGMELITVARKPPSERTVAANVLKHGTGGINVDACRVGTSKDIPASGSGNRSSAYGLASERGGTTGFNPHIGRWPANVVHDGSDEVLAAFPSASTARFFYSAKATKADRADSKHPTVKPVRLMRWLVRLVTPPGGTVLDPFAGSGTTGEAAMLEGFDAVLIEADAQHAADIRHRIKHWSGIDAPLLTGVEP